MADKRDILFYISASSIPVIPFISILFPVYVIFHELGHIIAIKAVGGDIKSIIWFTVRGNEFGKVSAIIPERYAWFVFLSGGLFVFLVSLLISTIIWIVWKKRPVILRFLPNLVFGGGLINLVNGFSEMIYHKYDILFLYFGLMGALVIGSIFFEYQRLKKQPSSA